MRSRGAPTRCDASCCTIGAPYGWWRCTCLLCSTPQFRIQRSKLRRRTQPVPPIYQPELAAEAVWHAAHHRRDRFGSASRLVLGERFAGPLLDAFLGRTGYETGPRPADAPDNLYDPVPGDHGAHGPF